MRTSVYIREAHYKKAIELGLNFSALLREALEKAIEEQTQRCSRCGQPLKERINQERGGGTPPGPGDKWKNA